MKVGVIDSGIDLARLYDGQRHGYSVQWIPVDAISFDAISDCDLIVIPAGTDNVLLHRFSDVLRLFLSCGGWIYCFDGIAPGIFAQLAWKHTTTRHRDQILHACSGRFQFLLDGVALDELECKEGIRGWWSEGELQGTGLVPLIADGAGRFVAALRPEPTGTGLLAVTAAARLPLFSADPSLAPNRLFANLLAYCRTARWAESKRYHLFVHSGNWAHLSFLSSERFGNRFHGVHWSMLDDSMLANAASIWVPWESNTPALRTMWPMIERAVDAGSTLVAEDLRDDWIPGVRWEPRPVDSSWWRQGRSLALRREPALSDVFGEFASSMYFWHYHGVFQGPGDAVDLLTAPDGKGILSLVPPSKYRKGKMILGTLDATFEYGAGKIPETSGFIESLLQTIEKAAA